MRDLKLSEGGFGSLYSLATIISAVLLLPFGPRMDTSPMRPYTLLVGISLGVNGVVSGFVLEAGISFSVLILGVAVLLAATIINSFRLWQLPLHA
ncbi:MAG: hypothetical protein ABIJ86_08320 [Spirochaetota bacterium]